MHLTYPFLADAAAKFFQLEQPKRMLHFDTKRLRTKPTAISIPPDFLSKDSRRPPKKTAVISAEQPPDSQGLLDF